MEKELSSAGNGRYNSKSSKVDAPVIEACFMNLECKYLWEREITENSPHVLMCLEVVNVCVDEQHLDETKQGRYGGNGLLYNIHYPSA